MRGKSRKSSGQQPENKSYHWDDGAKSFVAGSLAGVLSKTVTAPLARLTILRQATAADLETTVARSMRAELRGIWKRGGLVHMFRGNAAAVLHRIPFSGVYHGTYACLRRGQTQGPEPLWTKLLNGSVAGAAACTAAYPLDLARSLIASGKASSPRIAHTLAAELRSGGPRSLYRGLCSTLLTVTPNLGVNYAVYDTVTQSPVFTDVLGMTSLWIITPVSAASAGIISSLLTHPLDVVRRVIQLDGANGTAPRFQNKSWATVAYTIASSSPMRLYRGLTPELAKVVPAVCLTFSAFEYIKAAMD